MHQISQQSPQRPEPIVLLAVKAMASNIGLLFQASSATCLMSFHRHHQMISRSQEAKTAVVSILSNRTLPQPLAKEGREVRCPQQLNHPLLMCSSIL